MSALRTALVRPKLDYPRVPYHELLRRTAERMPDKWATVFHDQTLSFRELEGLSNALANGLRALGVGKGDRVALFMSNRPEYLVSFESISKAGGVVTPINPAYHEQEVEYQLNDAEARVLIVHEARAPQAPRLRVPGDRSPFPERPGGRTPPAGRVLASGGAPPPQALSWDEVVAAHPASRPPDIAFDVEHDLVALPYSSGTTGLPKG